MDQNYHCIIDLENNIRIIQLTKYSQQSDIKSRHISTCKNVANVTKLKMIIRRSISVLEITHNKNLQIINSPSSPEEIYLAINKDWLNVTEL